MFQFKVSLWDNKDETDCGIVVGSTYREAMDALAEYYGEQEIMKCELEPIGESDNLMLVRPGFTDIKPNLAD